MIMLFFCLSLLNAQPEEPLIHSKMLDEFYDFKYSFKTTSTSDCGTWEVVPEEDDILKLINEDSPSSDEDSSVYYDEDDSIYYVSGDPLEFVSVTEACDFTTTTGTSLP